jgi:hypothetical protein
MPDGFNNAAWKCLEGTHVLLITAFHNDSSYAAISGVVDPQDCP